MDSIYLILVIVLFALAISDLIVGVSNDAVNFLNSAVGAKAGSLKLIMLIAAAGVFIGATFSTGMMEVARKGIFHPEQFYFNEIIIIFLAVMITDVILLDFFNTIGFPTSTTVSIVFEILGAAVAVSIVKMTNNADLSQDINTYINSASAMKIIFGILISVIVAFSVGALIQYLVRLWFTFDYEKNISRFGSIYGGLAIATITYFILVKGLKGSPFANYDMPNGEVLKDWVKHNAPLILGISFVGWTLILQVLSWITKINILKFIVFLGTFALAMAFAGNDLVNFIGVPMAGYNAFEFWQNAGSIAPGSFLMTDLAGKVPTNTLFLLIAGFVMVITLYTSKKAKNVIKTSLDLSRQEEGSERFGSSILARTIVRSFKNFGASFGQFVPGSLKRTVDNRFTPIAVTIEKPEDRPAFDLLRASVILVVSSALISFATSQKLPLSTTYVTFMVAMGASLADRAWGRESAVYRITGVISVIGGWFLTALSAFTVAFVLAYIIHWTNFPGIFILVVIAGLIIFRTHRYQKRKMKSKEKQLADIQEMEMDEISVIRKCSITVIDTLKTVSTNYGEIINGLITEDRKKLKKALKSINELNQYTKSLKDSSSETITKIRENDVETGHYYIQVLDYLREIAHCLTFIAKPAFDHIDNNHKELVPAQVEELGKLHESIKELFDFTLFVMKDNKYDNVDELIHKQQLILDQINTYKKKQLKRIKNKETGTRNTMLYMELLSESKNLLLHSINLLKSQRDFIVEHK
ncbi:MAG: phosphate permease [Bacteroidetes bacterium]|nr:phosphate permease [Bacteroidota bacterium]